MLKDTGDQNFTESKEFDRICGHATMPYRTSFSFSNSLSYCFHVSFSYLKFLSSTNRTGNKWGESDLRIPPETNDYRTTDAPHAPWPEATRFQLARDKFGVQTRKDRKNLDDTKNALKRQATGA